ncbi:MAG TPA: ACT domain-containing protein [Thermoplasmata archaeon]|nr:ACT domain-containing protein [Thermoplasmata archaeon]
MPLIEILLRLPNRPGALAGVARKLAEHRINVAAISVEATAKQGTVRLVVSDPARAVRLLRAQGLQPKTGELIPVHLEERTGSLLRVLDRLAAAKINVRYVTLLVQRDGARVLVALGVDSPKRAQKALSAAGYYSSGAEGLVSNSDLVAAAPAIPSESVGLLL